MASKRGSTDKLSLWSKQTASEITASQILLVDEADVLRGLSFSADKFLHPLKRLSGKERASRCRLVPCLFATVPPSGLAPVRGTASGEPAYLIPLQDFRPWEFLSIIERVGNCIHSHTQTGAKMSIDLISSVLTLILRRVYHWTNGHPYLSQKLASAAVREWLRLEDPAASAETDDSRGLVDRLCNRLFLTPPTREEDCNLAIVRGLLQRSGAEIPSIIDDFRNITSGSNVRYDPGNCGIERLVRVGAVALDWQHSMVRPRNRIYEKVFGTELA